MGTEVRVFRPKEHIVNVASSDLSEMFDDSGRLLDGIRGRAGSVGTTAAMVELGADLIEMLPGAAFPLHVHPGDHLLYVVEGRGIVHVDGTDHTVTEGDTIFVPADLPHAVKTFSDGGRFCILAVGHPHKHVSSTDRMTVVRQGGIGS